ncbi:MAG: hypothetical protein NT001_03095 [Candidatus Woesearchaeota archaeon]|nr:hypothetical protein [Candidatus Woesearchaeota archaeon]
MALNQVLVDYIQNQIRKGFSLDRIKEFLLGQGYNPSEVNDAASAITKERIESMKSYIKQEIKQGNDNAGIRSMMMSYGYSEGEVNEAMKSAASKIPSWAILILLVSFVIIGGFLYVVSRPSTEIVSIPTATAPSTPGSQPMQAEPTSSAQIPPVTETGTATTGQNAEFANINKKYDVINATSDEKIMKAVQMCDNTANEIYKDTCFDQLSKATRDYTLCSKITDSVQRDNCYKRTAIYTQNREVCSQIADPQIRGECQIYEYV